MSMYFLLFYESHIVLAECFYVNLTERNTINFSIIYLGGDLYINKQ